MSNQLQITGGAKVRSLEGVITGTTGVLGSLPINTANGIPQLDSNGKILVSQLPNSVMEYKGTWNVSTNTPYLVNGVGNAGDVYLVEGAATGGTTHNFGAGNILFFNGDQTIYDGSAWQRASGSTGTVTSVAITESGDALSITGSPITTSGTINIGFAGTSAQYVAGDGTLITFPTTISSAQNLITEVYNETGATLTKGTVVYINGGHGNLPTITKALATSDATSAQTYGVVREDITDHNNGYVTVIGRLENLDTQAYATGTQLYLSSTTAGAWTSTKQYAPAHLVYVGIVTRSHPTQGVVEVKIQNGYELDELHNVSAQTPSNNQGLFYNSSTSLWENKSIATALGYTPVQGTGTTNYITKWTASGTIGNSMITDDGTTAQVNGSMNVMGGLLVAPSSGFPQATITSTGTTELRIQASSTSYTSDIKFTSGPTATYGLLRYDNSSNYLSLYSNSTAYARLFSNGNFAIGTTLANNGFKLEVEGTTKISGQLTLGSTITNGTYTYTLPGATGTLALSGEIATFSVVAPLAYFGGVLSMPQSSGSQNGYLSSTDWTTFNNKQNALGFLPIGGSGSINYISKFTGSTTISQSGIYEGVTNYVSIGNTNSTYNLDVTGTGRFTGALNAIFSNTSGVIDNNAFLRLVNTGTSTLNQSVDIVMRWQDGTYNGTGGISMVRESATARSGKLILQPIDSSGNNVTALTLASTGAATFSSSVTANSTSGISGSFVSSTYFGSIDLQNTGGDVAGKWNVQANSGAQVGGSAGSCFGIYSYNASAYRLWINASGNVGIGTTSPGASLTVAGGRAQITGNTAPSSGTGLELFYDGTGAGTLAFARGTGYIPNFMDGSQLQFFTSSSERMRITSGGQVLIGQTAASGSTNGIYFRPGIESGFIVTSDVALQLSRLGTTGDIQTFFSGTTKLGKIAVNSSYFTFESANNGGITVTSSGDVVINSTSPSSSAKFNVFFSDNTNNGQIIRETTGNPSVGYLLFNSNGTQTGSIIRNASSNAVLYVTSSDYRLKEDLKEFNALELISKIKTYNFKWKDSEDRMNGVLAHELQEILPFAVSGKKDEVNKDGTIKPQGVDYSMVVSTVVKSIQEIVDKYDNKISILEAQIEELKAKING